MAVCKSCGAELVEGAAFCMKCGSKVEVEAVCPNCSEKLMEGAAFCMKCGTKVGATVTQEELAVSANEDDTETESMDFTPDDEKKLVVSPDGSTGYSKIQDAVNAAEDGNEIIIMPGTYNENGIDTEKSITITGKADANSKYPTIKYSGSMPNFENIISYYGNVTLRNLNLEMPVKPAGSDDEYLAIFAHPQSNFYFENLTITGDVAIEAQSVDGDDFSLNSDCVFKNCKFTANSKMVINDFTGSNSVIKAYNCDFSKCKVELDGCSIKYMN